VKIPTLLQTEINEFIESMRLNREYLPKVTWSGDDNALGDSLIEDFVAQAMEIFRSSTTGITKSREKKTEALELGLTKLTVEFFSQIPTQAKFEPGFWSYLSFRLSPIILWRYPPNEKEGWGRNFVSKHSPSDFIDGFLPRILVRGQIAVGSELAESFLQQDFWRSHILRVKTGFCQTMSQSFAEKVVSEKLPVEVQRAAAKKLRSIRSNVVFELLDKPDCEKLIKVSFSG
jgi:hypothetical protein